MRERERERGQRLSAWNRAHYLNKLTQPRDWQAVEYCALSAKLLRSDFQDAENGRCISKVGSTDF